MAFAFRSLLSPLHPAQYGLRLLRHYLRPYNVTRQDLLPSFIVYVSTILRLKVREQLYVRFDRDTQIWGRFHTVVI